jgi:hypothetical protein
VPPKGSIRVSVSQSRLTPLIGQTLKVEGVPFPQEGWIIKGKVRKALFFDPPFLQFGGDLVPGLPFAFEKVSTTALAPLQGVDVECVPPLAETRIKSLGGNPEKYEIQVKPLPSLPPGTFRFDVLVKPLDATGTALPPIMVPAEGRVREEVEATPSTIYLGVKKIGTSCVETVVLHSPNGKPFEIEKIESSSSSVHVEPCSAAGLDGKAFRIIQQVSEEGPHANLVTFAIRIARQATLQVSLRVDYHGSREIE